MTEGKWKRKLPGRIYDYNYKVSEGYYRPQTDYLERVNVLGHNAEVPTAMTYAERFAHNPWYGKTKGLPYEESRSALNEPLKKLSDISERRASSIIRELKANEHVPAHVRASRRRKKYEEEEEMLLNLARKPQRSISHEMELNDSLAPKRASIRNEIRKLDAEIDAILEKPKRGRKIRNYEYTVNSDLGGVPGTKTITHAESAYASPYGRSNIRRISRAEVSTSSSASKPPVVPRNRRPSGTNDQDVMSKMAPVPRSRRDSVGEQMASAFHTRSYRSSSITSDNDVLDFSKAKEIRDVHRMRESEDLTENIHRMVDRMRIRDIDPELAYKYTRDIRASSLDPYENDSRYKSRRSARAHNFVYGIGHH